MACFIILAGRVGTNFSSSLVTYWDWDRVTVKSACCTTSTPRNQDRGPTCFALNPSGPVNLDLNHSKCGVPLCATMISSTYTPTTIILSLTLLEKRHGSWVELMKFMLSTRYFLNFNCHIREACFVPYKALRNFNTHGKPLGSLWG